MKFLNRIMLSVISEGSSRLSFMLIFDLSMDLSCELFKNGCPSILWFCMRSLKSINRLLLKRWQRCPSHPSIFIRLSGAGSRGQLPEQGHPDLPLPGGSQGAPWPAGRHSHSSVSWVFLGVSTWRNMPGTPPEAGIPGASETDARATSAGSSRHALACPGRDV